MALGLQELISPMNEPEFRRHLRERKTFFHRQTHRIRLDQLLSWGMLRNAIATGSIPADCFIVTAGAKPLPAPLYVTDNKINSERFNDLFSKNVSLITKPIERYVPALHALCSDLARRLGENVAAAAVATSGAGGALELHFDAPDILALQIEGSKRWRLYDSPVDHPIKGMHSSRPSPTSAVFDEVLNAGDVLFVPGGYWHQCDNVGPDVSLHVSIMITAPTGWHAMRHLMPSLLSETAFRVPLTRFGDQNERAAHEAALKDWLLERIRGMSMAEFASKGLDRGVANTERSPAPAADAE